MNKSGQPYLYTTVNCLIFVLLGALLTHPTFADIAVQNPLTRSAISLDGPWDTIVDPYENGLYGGYYKNAKPKTPEDLIEYDFARSPKLNVPSDWNSQDDKLFWYEGTIWYHRDVEVTVDASREYLLYFGAVNYRSIVYVNGKKVGTHEGGFTPFQFDVTHLLTNGINSIVVKLDNRRERDQVPTVSTDWWNYGGITRSVRLIDIAKQHIDDYEIHLNATKSNVIEGFIHVTNPSASSAQRISLRIPALHVDKQLQPDASGTATFSIPVKPLLWSPARPTLYAVKLRYGDDNVTDDIGFRHIEVRGEDILLNGKPVFLKGINIHEESPLHPGRAWSDEDATQLLTWAKDLGCNYVRLAHYPHNEAMLRMADKMGLMVWSEIPVYWNVLFDDSTVYDKAELQLREMIIRDRNRASIVLWSVPMKHLTHLNDYGFSHD